MHLSYWRILSQSNISLKYEMKWYHIPLLMYLSIISKIVLDPISFHILLNFIMIFLIKWPLCILQSGIFISKLQRQTICKFIIITPLIVWFYCWSKKLFIFYEFCTIHILNHINVPYKRIFVHIFIIFYLDTAFLFIFI